MLSLRGAVAVWATLCLANVAYADDPQPPATGEQPPSDTQPPVEEPPAVKAFEEGRTLLELGKNAEACVLFQQSIDLDPDAPGTLLNLGLCNARLGKTATALAWFRKAQFRAAEQKKPDFEDAAKKETLILSGIVPRIHFELANPAPPSATFFLDGNRIAEVDMASLEVDPGTRVLEMHESGKPPLRVEFTAKLGDKTTIAVPVPRTVKQVIVVDHGAPQKALSYMIGGAGVSLYIASVSVSLIAKHEFDAAEHPEDRQHWKNIARFGGTTLFGLGTVGLAAAVYLYVRAPKAEHIERTVLAPSVNEHSLGVAVVGSF